MSRMPHRSSTACKGITPCNGIFPVLRDKPVHSGISLTDPTRGNAIAHTLPQLLLSSPGSAQEQTADIHKP
jgi:hypothetical protein